MLLDVLGSGGMGVVYAAFDPELNRRVAIKLVRAELGRDEHGRARMVREAQAMARLSHPNVVSVYDVGIAGDGSLFIAIELVEGGTLSDWLRQSPRSGRDVLAMFIAAGRGLAAAHRAGLVHRDFKPENVLVGTDGRPRVTDFGLVCADSADNADSVVERTTDPEPISLSSSSDSLQTPLTNAGVVMGTPGYMSPEQCASLPTDARSDQFSFCAALYRALYGERPFEGSTEGDHHLDPARAHSPGAARHASPGSGAQGAARRLERGPLGAISVDGRPPGSLLDDPSLRRRRWLTGVAAVVLIGVGAALVQRTATHRARMCHDGSEALSGVWDSTSKQQLQQAFVRSGAPTALDTWERTERVVEEYARAWVAMRGEACEATRIRGSAVGPGSVVAYGLPGPTPRRHQGFHQRLFRAEQDPVESGDQGRPRAPAARRVRRHRSAAHARQAARRSGDARDGRFASLPAGAGDGAARCRPLSASARRRAASGRGGAGDSLPAARSRDALLARQNPKQPRTVERGGADPFACAWAAEAGGHQEIAAMTSAALVGEIGYDLGRTDWRIWAELTRAVLEHLGGNRRNREPARERESDCQSADRT